MTVETGSFISALNANYPASGDGKVEGDDHIRFIKAKILETAPNVTGAVTATHTELNYVVGVTSAIQTQIAAKAPSASPTFTGVPIAPTATLGTNNTQIATTAYVDNTAMSTTLPTQTGYNGRMMVTDGSIAAWIEQFNVRSFFLSSF